MVFSDRATSDFTRGRSKRTEAPRRCFGTLRRARDPRIALDHSPPCPATSPSASTSAPPTPASGCGRTTGASPPCRCSTILAPSSRRLASLTADVRLSRLGPRRAASRSSPTTRAIARPPPTSPSPTPSDSWATPPRTRRVRARRHGAPTPRFPLVVRPVFLGRLVRSGLFFTSASFVTLVRPRPSPPRRWL